MRRGRRFVQRIDRDRPEHAERYRKRFLERRAALRLFHVIRERRPRQFDAATLRLGRGRLRLGAADRGDAAFAARDALGRLMQIADRAFAADRPVIEMRRFGAEPSGKLLFRIAVAPAQEIDDVERADIAESLPPLSASARFSASSSRVSGSRPAAMSFGRSTISPTPTMTGIRSSGVDDSGISSCFTFELLIDASVIASFVGWAKARERRAHHPPPRTRLVGTLRSPTLRWRPVWHHSATSAFMCSTASAKSSLNSCTTALADFTLSISPTP